MDLGLANAAAVVVGGSRGMGLATARCLAEDGARVAVIGRTEAALDSAVADLSDRGSPDTLASSPTSGTQSRSTRRSPTSGSGGAAS
jgi:3-oxoacyl-[acyl-carrier protein] reductase